MNRLEDEDWFEVTEDLWREPREQPTKLKLCADHSVPLEFVSELRAAGIPVLTAQEVGIQSKYDPEIITWAKGWRRALITFDRDFWDDRKFPLHSSGPLIFVDARGKKIDDALKAFGLVYGTFLRTFSLERRRPIKIRATSDCFYLKTRGGNGQTESYVFELRSGILHAKLLSAEEQP